VAGQPNPGHLPDECVVRDEAGEAVSYRRVHVVLQGGYDSRKAGHAPWPSAGGKPPTNWKLSRPPHAFEIATYEVV